MLNFLKKCPQKVQLGLGQLFYGWGAIVDRCTIFIFFISLSCMIYAGSGLRYAAEYAAGEFAFTP